MSKKKHLSIVCLIFTGSLLLQNCNVNKDKQTDKNLLEIGAFKVSLEEFNYNLRNLRSIDMSITQKEACKKLLDNYINVGIIIEIAKQNGYPEKEAFVRHLDNYRKELYIKYTKNLRLRMLKLPANIERRLTDYFQDSIIIDYIWIPSRYKETSKQLTQFLIEGGGMISLSKRYESKEWNNPGIRIFNGISLKTCLFTENILKKVCKMREYETKKIHTKSGFHVIRFVKRIKSPQPRIDIEIQLAHLKIAYALEKGDTILDDYVLSKAITLNKKLLQETDLSISPFKGDDNSESDNQTIVEFGEKKITTNQLKKEIYRLPQNIQGLFRNKCTCKKAIATLVLLKNDSVSSHKQCINKELKGKLNIAVSSLLNTNEVEPDAENVEGTEQMDYYKWLTPENLCSYDKLKFNYEAIETMEIPYENNPANENILAYAGIWKLSVKEFKDALDKLTPESRIDIAKRNIPIKAIEYLANHEGGINNPARITINYKLLNRIDLLGNSFDIYNLFFREKDTIGYLGNVTMTVGHLRWLVSSLPEEEKSMFLNAKTKENAFKELLIREFWLKSGKTEEIENNISYQEDLKKYENWLLFEMLYKSEIFNGPLDVYEGNWFYHKYVEKTDEKLAHYVRQYPKEVRIELNKELLQQMGIDASTLEYKTIIKYPETELVNM